MTESTEPKEERSQMYWATKFAEEFDITWDKEITFDDIDDENEDGCEN